MKTGSNKRTQLLLGVLVVCVIAWFYTKNSGTEEIAQEGVEDNSALADQATVLLQRAESIKFDFSVLESKAFSSLINRNLPLLNLPVGRDNPFAPAP